MRKLLIFTLVLGMTSLASAALSLRIEDGSGTVDPMYLEAGSTYKVWVAGTTGDAGNGGLYGVPFGHATDQWDEVSLSNPSVENAAGDLGSNQWNTEYYGWEWTVADASTEVLPDIATGDWFDWDLTVLGSYCDTFQLDLYHYGQSGYYTPVLSVGGHIIPEPMTIALLGLGGLLLRRRK